ncbi:unspecific monooxygenase [Salvia divinorum]|uniref:Unspecific monooxygenase n=1 Tax=Salvia divinorum TaxID=28513 RepID=A0ABD1IHW5_SALDI
MVALHELTVPLFSFILLIIFLKRRRSTANKTLPPSPRKLPIIGNLHQLGKSPHRSLLSLSKRHGELMLLHLGSKPVVVASSAAAAREIMKNQDLIFSNRPKLSVPNRLTYGSRDVAFSPYGEYWRQVRSICVLQLLSNKRVQSFRRVREEETSLMIERIGRSSAVGAAVNLSEELVATTNNVICRVALGRKYGGGGGEERRFKKFLSEFVELLGASPVGDLITWLAWVDRVGGLNAKVERVAKLFDEFLEHVVREHRDMEKLGRVDGDDDQELDFVDILLQFQRENEKTSIVEDETIKALILDMFAGGTDTTVSSMEWTMAELIRNQEP